MREHKLTAPLTEEKRINLKAGDTVLLTGTIYTARDAAHARMAQCLKKGENLPFDISCATIYYAGPTPTRPGDVIGSVGPTTSGRMDAFSPQLLDMGLACMIGKGERNAEVIEAIKRNKSIYLVAAGGGGALMAGCVKSVEIVCWEDLKSEAVRRLTVENMPLTVAIDACGGNIYKDGPAAYLNYIKGQK